MALSFSMQAIGFFIGSIIAVAILAIFKTPISDNIDNLDYVWRICIGIGI
jgi:hypothetical protein